MYLILPGYSIKNKEEAEAIASALIAKGKQVYVHTWRHWANPNIEWNPQEELKIIKGNITEPFNMIGKSIGTYIGCALLTQYTPHNLVLMGIPVNDLTPQELDVYYNLGKIKNFTVIQNLYDPHGAATQIEALLTGNSYKLITKNSSDHSYLYIEDILTAVGLN